MSSKKILPHRCRDEFLKNLPLLRRYRAAMDISVTRPK
jgi:hypothetical protein